MKTINKSGSAVTLTLLRNVIIVDALFNEYTSKRQCFHSSGSKLRDASQKHIIAKLTAMRHMMKDLSVFPGRDL